MFVRRPFACSISNKLSRFSVISIAVNLPNRCIVNSFAIPVACQTLAGDFDRPLVRRQAFKNPPTALLGRRTCVLISIGTLVFAMPGPNVQDAIARIEGASTGTGSSASAGTAAVPPTMLPPPPLVAYSSVPRTPSSFERLLEANQVPPAFAQWLFSQQIVQSNHFAMVSTTEEGVDKIMAMAEAAGFSFANLMERVAVRQAWAVCRKQLSSATDNSTNASGSDPDARLPKETEDDLQAVWDKKHSFVIPDGWLLMPSLQVKMWRAMTAEKRSMEVLLVEHLRPMSCSDRPVNQTLAIVAGRPIEAVPVMVDQVTRHIEIYTRTWAWFFTMAFIAARHPEFMDLQTAIYGSERVLHFLSVTYGNQLPPAAFFLTAWASTIHVFAETLRLTKTPFKEQICSPATWEHLWSGWQPTAGRSSNTQGADLPRKSSSR